MLCDGQRWPGRLCLRGFHLQVNEVETGLAREESLEAVAGEIRVVFFHYVDHLAVPRRNRIEEQSAAVVTKEIFSTRPKNRTSLEVRMDVRAVLSRRPCLAMHRRARPVHLPPTTGNESAFVKKLITR